MPYRPELPIYNIYVKCQLAVARPHRGRASEVSALPSTFACALEGGRSPRVRVLLLAWLLAACEVNVRAHGDVADRRVLTSAEHGKGAGPRNPACPAAGRLLPLAKPAAGAQSPTRPGALWRGGGGGGWSAVAVRRWAQAHVGRSLLALARPSGGPRDLRGQGR